MNIRHWAATTESSKQWNTLMCRTLMCRVDIRRKILLKTTVPYVLCVYLPRVCFPLERALISWRDSDTSRNEEKPDSARYEIICSYMSNDERIGWVNKHYNNYTQYLCMWKALFAFFVSFRKWCGKLRASHASCLVALGKIFAKEIKFISWVYLIFHWFIGIVSAIR